MANNGLMFSTSIEASKKVSRREGLGTRNNVKPRDDLRGSPTFGEIDNA